MKITEIILALCVFLAVIHFSIETARGFFCEDWSEISVMYEFISFSMLIFLGLEIIRLILIQSINVVMELILLIIARKMLYSDITPFDLLLCVVAFCLTVGVYYLHGIKPIKSLEDLTS